MMFYSGAKAPLQFELLAARLKSCPDTCFVVATFTAAAKAVLMAAENAGLKACSTPWGTVDGFDKGINACSTPWGTADGFDKGINACSTPRGTQQMGMRKGINACSTPWGEQFSGAKAPVLRPLYAALKGRSSTADLSSTMRVKVLPQGLKPQVFETANGTTPQPSIASLPQAKRSSRALTLVSAWTLLPHQRGGASMGVR
jgi:hypothetical protein